MKDSNYLVIKAKNFTEGNLQGFNPGFRNLALTGEDKNSYAEYLFSIDETVIYKLYAVYAAVDSRPVSIYLDGELIKSDALDLSTGGWDAESAGIFLELEVELSLGQHTLRIQRDGLIPHIKEFIFVKKGITLSEYIFSGNRAGPIFNQGYFAIAARNFSKGNLQRFRDIFKPLVVGDGGSKSLAEYVFYLDESAIYKLYAVYAAVDSRPVSIYLDGELIKSDALGLSTGGWNVESSGVFLELEVDLNLGQHTLRIEREGLIPHIKEFIFVKKGIMLSEYIFSGDRAGPVLNQDYFAIAGRNFSKGNLQRFHDIYRPLVVGDGEGKSLAEYVFCLDEPAIYKLYAVYAAVDSRPVSIYLDGELIKSDALGLSTGGWDVESSGIFLELEVELNLGQHTLRIQRDGLIPHIKEFIFVKKGIMLSEYIFSGDRAGPVLNQDYFVIAARNFSKGNLQRFHDTFKSLVVDDGRDQSLAEYVFCLDESAIYKLYAVYAAVDSRPVSIYFDGELIKSDALGLSTGGWNVESSGVFLELEVGLNLGQHTLRIEREGLIPHIKEFIFVKKGIDIDKCFTQREKNAFVENDKLSGGAIVVPPEIIPMISSDALRVRHPELMKYRGKKERSHKEGENSLLDAEVGFFYGNTAESHRWGCDLDEFDFLDQIDKLKKCRESKVSCKVVIGVRRTNFYKLKDVLCVIDKAQKGKVSRKIPNFSFHPFKNIKKRFDHYFKGVNKFLNRYNIYLELKDNDLNEIFEIIESSGALDFFDRDDMLRALGPVCKDVFTGPHYILLNLSGLCNTDCVYCRKFSSLIDQKWKDKFSKGSQLFNINSLKKVLRDASDINTKTVLIVGEGEPLIYPEFSKVIKLIKKYGLNFNFSTNGMLLHKYSKKLIDGNCASVTVSLSFATEDGFKKMRPKTSLNAFHRIEENIRELSDLKKRNNTHSPEIILLHAINRLNYQEIIEMARKAKKLGANSLWYQLVHLEDFSYHHLKLDDLQMEEVKRGLLAAKKICEDSNIKFHSFIDFEIDHYNPDSGDWSHKGLLEEGCFVGWHFAYLDLREVISFCCGMKVVGFLEGKHGFKDSWYSDTYRRYRNDGLIMHKENPLDLYGKPLYDKFCDSCDNHNQNIRMIELLKRYDMFKFVER